MNGRGSPNQRAFSLVESVVVMLIIILLASIVIPGFLRRGKEEEKLPLPILPGEEKKIDKLEGDRTDEE